MFDDNENTQKKIREMAHLSILNGQLNPIQEKNLKMYPFVFFNGVIAASIDYDITGRNRVEVEEDEKTLDIKYKMKQPETRGLKVIYNLEIDEKADNSNLEKRFEAIKGAVTNLLWPDMLVEVKFNDISVFKSK